LLVSFRNMPPRRQDPLVRYRRYVDASGGPDACWPWTGSRSRKGYGSFFVGPKSGRTMQAHRFGYTTLVGVIPAGLDVCHSCDHPWCQNPKHWWLGTNQQNTADKVAKGRASCLKGSANAVAKLTWEQVEEIRSRYVGSQRNTVRTGPTQEELAAEYGVTQRVISNIVLNKGWRK
jgi:hypothetical protein